MINNIVFDMGQVLIRWNPAEMLRQFDLTEEERALILCELFTGVEWIQQDRGVLDEEAVVKSVCDRLPEKLHGTVRELVYGWHQRFLSPIPGMAELVRELKGEGYRLYLLSNASAAVRSYFNRIPGSECFEQLMISAEEKLLKPSHEIYEQLFSKFGLLAEECWFIDDNPANVEGALSAGMRGTIFRADTARLRRELRAAGIRCNVN